MQKILPSGMSKKPPEIGGKTHVIMIQGTSSYCGKTFLVAALCKIFADSGFRVAPFKALNMSLNSFVTRDGKEIARAQALQALAAGVEPRSDMNPILLKPKGRMVSQVVLNGRPYKDIRPSSYDEFAFREGMRSITESLDRLMAEFEILVVEGVGSPAEINLYDHDIANMRIADIVNAPVVLVGDIDRGGVFASIVGTLKLLKPRHRARVKGLIINKFRGDLSILEPGLRRLERMMGKPVLGVVPYIDGLQLPSEDSVSLEEAQQTTQPSVEIAVVRFPGISNFTDFEPFKTMSGVWVHYITSGKQLGAPDAIVLPGTKNTIQDLLWLRESGLADEILRMAKEGTPIIGICGGYQILGKYVVDKDGIEGDIGGEFQGLGLLDVITYFEEYDKVTEQVLTEGLAQEPIFGSISGRRLRGYEIHMGRTVPLGKPRPVFRILQRGGMATSEYDGAVGNDGVVIGTYVHGLFENKDARESIVNYLSQVHRRAVRSQRSDSLDIWQESLEKLGNVVRSSIDMSKVLTIIGLPTQS